MALSNFLKRSVFLCIPMMGLIQYGTFKLFKAINVLCVPMMGLSQYGTFKLFKAVNVFMCTDVPKRVH